MILLSLPLLWDPMSISSHSNLDGESAPRKTGPNLFSVIQGIVSDNVYGATERIQSHGFVTQSESGIILPDHTHLVSP